MDEWNNIIDYLQGFDTIYTETSNAYANRKDELVSLLCEIIIGCIQAGSGSLNLFPPIIYQVKHVRFRFLFHHARKTHDNVLYSRLLRLFYDLFIEFRQFCPFEIELIFNNIYLMNDFTSSNHNDNTRKSIINDKKYQFRQIVLESLLDFISLPFLLESYYNFDCKAEMTFLCENLFQFLCKCVLLVNKNIVTSNHILALKCLVKCLQWMKPSISNNLNYISHGLTNWQTVVNHNNLKK